MIFRTVPTCILILTVETVHAQPPLYGGLSRPLAPQKPRMPVRVLSQVGDGKFFLLTTDLSPAVLVHTEAKEARFFSNLGRWGLGSPRYCVVPLQKGVRVLRRGES